MAVGLDLWESFCIRVGTYVIGMLPDAVRNGIHTWGLDYPPITNLALPAVSNYDTGVDFKGFCGLGYCDVGNGILSLTSLVMNGLDTAAMTPGQAPTFTEPDTTMTIPLTVGSLQVTGSFEMDHLCRKLEGKCEDSKGPVFTSKASGTLRLTVRNAQLVVTIGGLDQNVGRAGSVTIRWAGNPPDPILDPPQISPETPRSASVILNNYFKLSKNTITSRLQDRLNQMITGDTPVTPGGRSLSQELLDIINKAFDAVP
jgi:hypothetical protein